MTNFLASFPSPPQGVWHLGPLPIRAYALFIIVGIIVALVIGDRRWVARGGEHGVIYDIALWAVPFGLVGGRLYHIITDWPKYFGPNGAGIVGALRIWEGGLGIWGAVALGGVGAWIGCRQAGIPLPAFGDAIAPGIVLAQAIGRLGNYFNQELYGGPTSLPWGLEIYERRDAAGNVGLMDGVSTGQLYEPHPVHPTFLYELLWNVLVFVVLIYVDRRFKIGHGRLFALYVAGYCVGRFWVELLRADPAARTARGAPGPRRCGPRARSSAPPPGRPRPSPPAVPAPFPGSPRCLLPPATLPQTPRTRECCAHRRFRRRSGAWRGAGALAGEGFIGLARGRIRSSRSGIGERTLRVRLRIFERAYGAR